MSDNRDDRSDHPDGGKADDGFSVQRPRSEDPLAELARLIDEDPFADFDRLRHGRGRRKAAQSADAGSASGDDAWERDDPLPPYRPREWQGEPDVAPAEDWHAEPATEASREQPAAFDAAPASPERDEAQPAQHELDQADMLGAQQGAEQPDHENTRLDPYAEDAGDHGVFGPGGGSDEGDVAVDVEEAEGPAPQAPAQPSRPTFDPVSAVAAHLFANKPRPAATAGGHGAAAADAQGAAHFSVDPPPEAHDIVRPPAEPQLDAAWSSAGHDVSPDGNVQGEPPDQGGFAWHLDETARPGDDQILAHERAEFGHEPGYREDPVHHADALSEGYPADGYADAPYPDERYYQGEAPLHLDVADDYTDFPEHDLPPSALDGSGQRPRRGLFVVASFVGLVVLGGAVALGYRGLSGDSGGEPPIIRADTSPTKVAAAEEAATEESQGGKLIYERIGGNEAEGEERLVSREEPVFEVDGRDDDGIRRVDVSGGNERGSEAGDAAGRTAAARDEPRRVRTVVVRPDGTVLPSSVETRAEDADGAVNADQSAEDATSLALAAEGEAERDFVPPSPPQSGADEPEAAPDDQVETAAIPEPAAEPEEETTAETGEAAGQTVEAEQADAQPRTDQQATQPRSGQPLQLGPSGTGTASADQGQATTQTAAVPSEAEAQEPSAAEQRPFPAGSYVVQVASTRSEDEARSTAQSIAQQHSGLLSDLRVGVERADLGERGVFYRVGAGGMASRSDATALCQQLQANGLDCFVRQSN